MRAGRAAWTPFLEDLCVKACPSRTNRAIHALRRKVLQSSATKAGKIILWSDLLKTPYILAHQNRNDFEILISGSFATHCICNGIVYFQATDRVQEAKNMPNIPLQGDFKRRPKYF